HAWGSATFVSLFGLYLAVKWSVIDKITELRLLPSIQKLNSNAYWTQWNELAEQHGIPHEGSDAWHGLMVRQFLQIFLPNREPNQKTRFVDYFTHVFSGKLFGKYRE